MTDEERIAWYRAQAEEARRMVADMDAGWTFHSSRGAGPMKDVTAEMRAQQLAVADHMEQLASGWERLVSLRI